MSDTNTSSTNGGEITSQQEFCCPHFAKANEVAQNIAVAPTYRGPYFWQSVRAFIDHSNACPHDSEASIRQAAVPHLAMIVTQQGGGKYLAA